MKRQVWSQSLTVALVLVSMVTVTQANPSCPGTGGVVNVLVTNAVQQCVGGSNNGKVCGVSGDCPSGTCTSQSVDMTFSGTLLSANCSGGSLATSYSVDFTCTNSNPTGPAAQCTGASVSGLKPGIWVHEAVGKVKRGPLSGYFQRQYYKDVVIGGSTNANKVYWTLFPQVIEAGTTNDSPTAPGSFNYSLAQAQASGANLNAPLLIQMDHNSTSLAITQNQALTDVTRSLLTIDPTNNQGDNGITVDYANNTSFGGWTISGAHNNLSGLTLKNIGGNRILLSISGSGADDNVLDRVVLTDTQSAGGTGTRGSHRLLISGGNGSSSYSVRSRGGTISITDGTNYIVNSEISGGTNKNGDLGVNVTNAYAVLEHNKIHHNYNGGIRAEATGGAGHMQLKYNMIDNNGISTNTNANGVAIVGGAELNTTKRNLIRSNNGRGLYVECNSQATLSGDYLASSANFTGMTVINKSGLGCNTANTPTVAVSGSTFASNQTDGAVVSGVVTTAGVAFGVNSSTGKNAFTANNKAASTYKNFHNDSNPGTSLNAINNQWEHSGAASTCDSTCLSNIGSSDITNASGASTSVSSPLMYRAGAPSLDTVAFYPTKVMNADDEVWIQGGGFNVIEGIPAGGDQCGSNPAAYGNCVQAYGVFVNVDAESPTTVFIPAGIGCSQPQTYSITRLDANPTPTPHTVTGTFCTNDP